MRWPEDVSVRCKVVALQRRIVVPIFLVSFEIFVLSAAFVYFVPAERGVSWMFHAWITMDNTKYFSIYIYWYLRSCWGPMSVLCA